MHVRHGQALVEPGDLFANQRRQFHGVALGAHRPPVARAKPGISIRHIDPFVAIGNQRIMPLMLHHPDDFEPFRLGSCDAAQQALADGAFMGKSLRREQLIDHQKVQPRFVIRVGKRTAGEQTSADGIEIPWEHEKEVGGMEPSRVGHRLLCAPAAYRIAAVEWQITGRRGGRDPR